jgi:hypothetical protein
MSTQLKSVTAKTGEVPMTRYWGGEPFGEVGTDEDGKYYMKCYPYNIDNSGYDSYEEAVEELKYCLSQVNDAREEAE